MPSLGCVLGGAAHKNFEDLRRVDHVDLSCVNARLVIILWRVNVAVILCPSKMFGISHI